MTTLHMKIEEVRNVANQIDLAVGELYFKPAKLKSAAGSLRSAWQGGRSAYYANQLQQMGSLMQREVIELQRLVKRLYAEVDQWEEVGGSFNFSLRGLGYPVFSSGFGIQEQASDRPNNMRDLAALVSALYNQDEHGETNPIRVVQIGPGEYLILIAGTIGGSMANNWNSAFRSGSGLPSDYQRRVREILMNEIPRDSTVHFSGHSQGGIMGNNLAADRDVQQRVRVGSVSTFGSPVSAEPQDGELGESNVTYRRYAALGDVVPVLSRDAIGVTTFVGGFGSFVTSLAAEYFSTQTIIPGSFNPLDAHAAYGSSEALAAETLPFTINEQYWGEGVRYDVPNATGSLPVLDFNIVDWVEDSFNDLKTGILGQ